MFLRSRAGTKNDCILDYAWCMCTVGFPEGKEIDKEFSSENKRIRELTMNWKTTTSPSMTAEGCLKTDFC